MLIVVLFIFVFVVMPLIAYFKYKQKKEQEYIVQQSITRMRENTLGVKDRGNNSFYAVNQIEEAPDISKTEKDSKTEGPAGGATQNQKEVVEQVIISFQKNNQDNQFAIDDDEGLESNQVQDEDLEEENQKE